ncbi:MAG: RsfS/YbeB/iojap family protein, partial [Elusimicrobiota bacterium]
NLRAYGIEGYGSESWILYDYIDFIVHIFKKETRDFYSLERLWNDAKKINLVSILNPKKQSRSRNKSISPRQKIPRTL